MDDTKAGTENPNFAREKNITDAPCLRYAEVLLNYVEAAYELHDMKPSYEFSQNDLDISINLIRDRAGVEMPHLQVMGTQPAV